MGENMQKKFLNINFSRLVSDENKEKKNIQAIKNVNPCLALDPFVLKK